MSCWRSWARSQPLAQRLRILEEANLCCHFVSLSHNLNLRVKRRDAGADAESAEGGAVEVVAVL